MTRIERMKKMLQALNPIYIDIVDESHKHSGHYDTKNEQGGSAETHLVLTMASPQFKGLSRLERQMLVNGCLHLEFDQGLHALSMKLFSDEEHKQN